MVALPSRQGYSHWCGCKHPRESTSQSGVAHHRLGRPSQLWPPNRKAVCWVSVCLIWVISTFHVLYYILALRKGYILKMKTFHQFK